ncbi:MAG: hypothetical protein ABJN40_13330 [Sneathiella sp.]
MKSRCHDIRDLDTRTRNKVIKALSKSYNTPMEIADEFNIAIHALNALNVPRPDNYLITRSQLLTALTQGYDTMQEIADKFNVSIYTLNALKANRPADYRTVRDRNFRIRAIAADNDNTALPLKSFLAVAGKPPSREADEKCFKAEYGTKLFSDYVMKGSRR